MYSHDGFGLGHFRRNHTIARRLVRADPCVDVILLASNASGIPFELTNAIDYIKLPSLMKVGRETWGPRSLNIATADLMEGRQRLIATTIDWFRPDVVLVDYLPLGVQDELRVAFDTVRQRGLATKFIFGIRDIIDEPETLRQRWANNGSFSAIREYYDHVLVYGGPSLFDTISAYGLDADTLPPAEYTGYVSAIHEYITSPKPHFDFQLPDGPLHVVVSGGGGDAMPMVSAVIEAFRKRGPNCPPAIIATGPLMCPEQRAALERQAAELPLRVVNGSIDQIALMAAADVVIAMGGYNTLVEAVHLAKPTLTIPRPGPSAEQNMRAQRLADLGLVENLALCDATPSAIIERLHILRQNKLAQRPNLDFDGGDFVACKIVEWLGERKQVNYAPRSKVLGSVG